MKSTMQTLKEKANNDDLISKMVLLESKDLSKKKKRKSINHSKNDLSPKKKKRESKSANVTLVPSPIKLEHKSQESDLSSEDEKELPARKKIKNGMVLYQPNTEPEQVTGLRQSLGSKSSKKQLSKQKPEKTDNFQSYVTRISDFEKKKVSPIKVKKEEEPGSSSEEEIQVPKPKKLTKIEAEEKLSTQLGSFSSSEEEVQVPKPRKLTKIEAEEKLSTQLGSFSSSEEEVEVPKPRKLTKSEAEEKLSTQLGSFSSSEEEVQVPKPRKLTKIEAEEKLSTRLGSFSSSEEEVQVPKPRKLKKIEAEEKLSTHLGSFSSSEEEVQVPKPRKLTKIEAEEKLSTQLGSFSSSEEEVQVPKPRKITKVEAEEKLSSHLDSFSSSKEVLVPKPRKLTKIEAEEKLNTHLDSFSSTIGITNNEESDKKNGSYLRHISPSVKESRIKKRARSSSSDSESSRNEGPITQKPNWIGKLQLKHPEYKKQINELNLPLKNSKYSLLRIPKNINPNDLLGLKCSFDKEVYVTLNNKQYLFQPLVKKPEPTFASLNGPRLLNLEKVIVLQKSKPLLTLNKIKVQKRTDISLPDAIKLRHPLFGVDYKEQLSVVKRRIKKATESTMEIEKRKRKKKHKVKQKYDLINDEKQVYDLLSLIN